MRCRAVSLGIPARARGVQHIRKARWNLAADELDRLGERRLLAMEGSVTSRSQSLGEAAVQVTGGASVPEARPEARLNTGRNIACPVGVAAASRPDGLG